MLLLAIVALGVPLAINLRARVNAEVRTQSQAQADLVAATAADLLGHPGRPELVTLARTAARSVRGRILVVNRTGSVLADSAGPAQVGSNYATRPEIRAALGGDQVQVQRYSRTLGKQILATAVPIIRNGHPVGAVRVTQSVGAVNSAVDRAYLGLGAIALVVLALGLLAGVVIAAQVVRPIRRLDQTARRVASGNLKARAELEGSREQRSLASSFNDMTERLARLLRAQKDFVADASHQLRTPLTALRLRLEAAKAGSHQDGVGEIDAAILEVDRLSGTVNELLLLSGAGERQVAPSDVELGTLSASAAERWRSPAADKGIALEHHDESGGSLVRASSRDAEQVLDVLIENAVHYSPAGGTVIIRSGTGHIDVLDRGPGIDEEERELVFERFHRGRAGRQGPPGSGLGLSIARELSRSWGGEVTLAPRADGGTVATFSLSVQSVGEPSEIDDHFARA